LDAVSVSDRERGVAEDSHRYTVYLIIVALAGWPLVSYDLNLLVLTVPDVAQEWNLSRTLVGSWGKREVLIGTGLLVAPLSQLP
jgi:hypothetical protein